MQTHLPLLSIPLSSMNWLQLTQEGGVVSGHILSSAHSDSLRGNHVLSFWLLTRLECERKKVSLLKELHPGRAAPHPPTIQLWPLRSTCILALGDISEKVSNKFLV